MAENVLIYAIVALLAGLYLYPVWKFLLAKRAVDAVACLCLLGLAVAIAAFTYNATLWTLLSPPAMWLVCVIYGVTSTNARKLEERLNKLERR